MEEPNVLIRWTIYVFAAGEAAIVGTLSIATTAILSLYPGRTRPLRPLIVGIVFAISSLVIACSSLPVPAWFQVTSCIWLILILIRLWMRHSASKLRVGKSKLTTAELVWFGTPLIWIATALAIEMPFHRWSTPTEPISTILVIGDSVTAGLNDGEDTWPRQLARESSVDVLDASQPGATVQSARRQNSLFSDRTGIVVLEIGGNDVLEGLPVEKFERGLDELLSEVTRPGRTVVMFELPLPPFSSAYGIAQRRQAGRHHVKLIPKRDFAQILTTRGATVDGIHLSGNGQTQMMSLIQSRLGPQMVLGTGTYQRFER